MEGVKSMEEYYVRKSDIERLIQKRIGLLEKSMVRGKGLKNSIVNLNALKSEIEDLYAVKFAFRQEQTIFRTGGNT